jgi:hypothetical protein
VAAFSLGCKRSRVQIPAARPNNSNTTVGEIFAFTANVAIGKKAWELSVLHRPNGQDDSTECAVDGDQCRWPSARFVFVSSVERKIFLNGSHGVRFRSGRTYDRCEDLLGALVVAHG